MEKQIIKTFDELPENLKVCLLHEFKTWSSPELKNKSYTTVEEYFAQDEYYLYNNIVYVNHGDGSGTLCWDSVNDCWV